MDTMFRRVLPTVWPSAEWLAEHPVLPPVHPPERRTPACCGSLGGIGVVALLVQDGTGFRAGHGQPVADAAIFDAAVLLSPATLVLWSLFGAVVLNLVIAVNHRRDRYIANRAPLEPVRLRP